MKNNGDMDIEFEIEGQVFYGLYYPGQEEESIQIRKKNGSGDNTWNANQQVTWLIWLWPIEIETGILSPLFHPKSLTYRATQEVKDPIYKVALEEFRKYLVLV